MRIAASHHTPVADVIRAPLPRHPTSALTRLSRDMVGARYEPATATRRPAAPRVPVPRSRKLTAADTAAMCFRQGQHWELRWGSRNAIVQHSVGMLHLAVLLTNPGQEIPSIELVAGVAALAETHAARMSAQPLLDAVAIQRYRHRLSQLRAELDGLVRASPPERAARARAEHDWLASELSSVTGERVRRFSDSTERARIAVGKAIRRAVNRIEDTDAPIGQHLRIGIHTGVRCSYRPPGDHAWQPHSRPPRMVDFSSR
jgi:hypothetical protein